MSPISLKTDLPIDRLSGGLSTDNRSPDLVGTHPIVDIAGPAGSGKSTVIAELFRQRERIEAGQRFRPFQPRHTAHALKNGASVICRWLPSTLVGRLSKEQIKWMLYLQSWDEILRRQREASQASIVIDQGPVFYMATLLAFGPDRLKQDSWWNEIFDRWASVLEIVVLLDAPTSVLMERVNERAKQHSMKGSTPEQMEQFLSLYRSTYRSVVSRLEASGTVRVLRIDSCTNSAADVVKEISDAMQDAGGATA